MSDRQKTIAREISLTGTGLHTGSKVNVLVKPAEPGAGVTFIRTDLPNHPEIKADVDYVLVNRSLPRCTSIGFQDVVIHTVEHFMAALWGMGVDNVRVELDGNELPGLDGSSRDYMRAIEKAGIEEQDAERRVFEIKEPIWVERNGASLSILPADDFKVSYILDYQHPFLGTQFFSSVLDGKVFGREIAPSRTFCLESEAEDLRRNGLGLGANYDNTLVINDKGVLKNTLRFDNEFVRHKVLDLIGDLYLLGMPVKGHVIAVKSGHTLNRALLQKICEQKKKFTVRQGLSAQPAEADPVLDIHGVMNILPHRYPFLFVDNVLELESGKRVVAVKNVTMNDYFFKGHFPTRPVMPGVIMVEAMAQAGGIALLSDEKNRGKVAFFMGTNNVKFRRVVIPGDQLIIEARVIKDRSKVAQIQAETKVHDQVVAEAEMMFSYTDESYLSP